MWPFWTAVVMAWLVCLLGGVLALFADPGAITMCIGAGIAAFVMTGFAVAFTLAERKGW